MDAVTQRVVDIARRYIPDKKTKVMQLVDEELGITSSKSGVRETFYVKNQALSTPQLFVEPYVFSGVASLNASAGTTSHYFMWSPTELSCTFGNNIKGYDPPANKLVKATYEYTKARKYLFTDNNLAEFIPDAVYWINNTYDKSYTYTGTSPNYTIGGLTALGDEHLLAMSVALRALNVLIVDLMEGGIGVSFRGSMHSLDNRDQLKVWTTHRDILSAKIDSIIVSGQLNDVGYGIDLYSEEEVDA